MESTQISIGGFGGGVTAKDLADYLENNIENIGTVARCRLKTSITPPFSYPKFTSSTNSIVPNPARVLPHAFVQFLAPAAVQETVKMAKQGMLLFNGGTLKVHEGSETYSRFQRRRNINPFRFTKAKIEVGSLVTPEEYLVAWQDIVDFHVDPFDDCCRIFLTKDQLFSTRDKKNDTVISCEFKMEFRVNRDIKSVKVSMERGTTVLFIELLCPPSIYYRTADDDIHVTVPFALLDDDDPWIRTLDFTDNNAFGRCLCYRISLSPRTVHTMEQVKRYFSRYHLLGETGERVFDSSLRVRPEGHVVPRGLLFFTIPNQKWICFESQYLLNGLIHKGILNYHSLNDRFYRKLYPDSTPLAQSTMALRHMHSYGNQIYDPCVELERILQQYRHLKAPFIGPDTMEVRRLIITPTKAYCFPPEIELSNRVLRRYRSVSDRFLRVCFLDESMDKLGSGALSVYFASVAKEGFNDYSAHKTAVFSRVRGILFRGFELCGRQYSFLAFSPNQLRDHSAWFFADGDSITAKNIRSWMGKFQKITNVAKHAARMGQCFSSTYSTVDVGRMQFHEIEDIKRNGYTFSDGIGKISPDLTLEVTRRLQLNINPPSAFQIRFGGYKGVVSTWPIEPGMNYNLLLRPSMNKFDCDHRTLEIISWTRFLPAYLNREIITLLSALGVKDKVFRDLQNSMVSRLREMLEKDEVAFDILTSSCSGILPNTAAVMIGAGFTPKKEPHLKDLLTAIRAVQLDDLLRKHRIFVPKGRWLMGCLDEVGKLEYGKCFIRASTTSLKDCFVKHGCTFDERSDDPTVVMGKVIIAKNPCLHPGDIRILEAVDIPELYHMVDCLVFPQKGSRPHPNEASGSDLDGDTYFVSWEPSLIPPRGESWDPMDYNLRRVQELPAGVKIEDILDFFTKSMVSEKVGVICNAHVVRADVSDEGALNEDCLELAKQAAIAVDFPKTGKPGILPPHLKPKQYPDFMEKGEALSYKSEKLLGVLYREIKGFFGEEIEEWEIEVDPEDIAKKPCFDADLEFVGYDRYIAEAWKLKCGYDQHLRSLLGQYNVKREGEVVSGYVTSISRKATRKQHGQTKERLGHAYRALRKEYRNIFEGFGGDQSEAKASAWYYVTYHPTWVQKALDEANEIPNCSYPLLLSFPWICADYLAKIKIQKRWTNTDLTSTSLLFTKGLRLRE